MSTTESVSPSVSSSNPAKTEASTSKMPMPSIDVLIKESWNRMTAGALQFILMYLLSMGAGIGTVVVFILLGIGIAASGINLSQLGSSLQAEGPAALSQVSSGTVLSIVALFVVFILTMSVVGTTFSNALILTMAEPDNKTSIGSLVKRGFKKVLPIILFSLLSAFLTFGSIWFFFIGTLMISIFFGFVIFEILFEDKSVFASIKSSVSIVAQNFGAILGRMLLFILAYWVIAGLLPGIFNAISPQVGAVYTIINLIISIPLSIYSISFSITLYKHAKAAADPDVKHNGLLWVIISLSLVGWLIFIAMFTVIINVIVPLIKEKAGAQKQFEQSFESEMEQELYNLDSMNIEDGEVIPAPVKPGKTNTLYDTNTKYTYEK